ncbi:MAG: metallophosphoesterase [Sphaerochaetaceae bacterium]|jgi:Icc-related predicted phosphoesterase|nr:metallophosphoesterase [Sphaerochaetaceae bacterium]
MKILCIADEQDQLVYSANIAERYSDVELVISAGDLPMRYYEFIVSSLNKPFYFVFGNHHVEDLHRYRKSSAIDDSFSMKFDRGRLLFGIGGECLEGRVVRDKATGLLLAGLGGSMRYNSGEHQYTEFEMFLRILGLVPKLSWNRLRYGRWLDILVAHAPPRGIGDGEDRCHTGFKAFLWFMRTFKPRYLVHGHVHLIDMNAPRISRYRETEVINVFSSHVLQDS